MRKSINLIIFFLGVVFVIGMLYSSGQEHTLIINNIYSVKDKSKNIVIKIAGEKERKIGKNKKIVMNLKGKTHSVIIKADGLEKAEIIEFNLNKGAEIILENFLAQNSNWFKII
ncbi:MAG: hypothetical protein ACRC0F_10775, partial [Cetobacterium sp.]